MKLLDNSHIVKRLSVIVVMATTIFGAIIGVTQNSKKEAGAITQDGANVTVNPGAELYNYGHWETHKYSIQSGATTFVGFCANPTKSSPAGSYPADLIDSSAEKYKKIQLAIYIYTVRNEYTSPIMESWFQTISDENTRYAYIHGIVGYLNDGTTLGLSSEQIGWLEVINQGLGNSIGENTEVWQQASRYQLYGLTLSSSNLQNIMWIEPKPFGSIKVTKKDATTNSATPQGNASFNGIKFTAKNKNGQIEKSCTLSNNSNSCTISDLEYGEYTVSESAGNNTYQVNVNTTETVTVDGGTEEVEFKNEVKKGNITVRKKDAKMQNGECKTTSGHSFNGITFGLYLDKTTSNRIKYGNKEYDPKSEQNEILIAKKTIGEDGCEVKFNNLPIAKYYIKEISANNDYIVSTEVERVNLTADKSGSTIEVEFSNQPTSIGTVAVDGKDGDQYVEVSPESNIKDTIQYCVEPNKNYTIKGVLMDKSTGKELLVNGKKVEGSVDLKPTTSCGKVVMEFELDTSALGGKEVVVFERLYEHKDDGNYDDEEPIVEHKDIDDPKQTIDIISLETVAEDGTDGDKEILADKAAVVKDTVSYCVKPGQKYTIRGILMDKSTGEPLLVNGEKIEGAVEIEPTEACGTAEMLFHFDATGLQGKELVVFEKLYIFGEDNPDEDEPIITHEDINDENQAVIIYMPTPDTGRFTAKDGDGRMGEFILAPVSIVIVVGGYGICRASARKRFLRRK